MHIPLCVSLHHFYRTEIDLNCNTPLFLSEMFDHFSVIMLIFCQRPYRAIPNGYLLITVTMMCFMTNQSLHGGKSNITRTERRQKMLLTCLFERLEYKVDIFIWMHVSVHSFAQLLFHRDLCRTLQSHLQLEGLYHDL